LEWHKEHPSSRFRVPFLQASIVLVLGSSFFWSPGFDHIVNPRMGAESIEPYGDTEEVPLPMRLFLGGSRDLRGFEAQTVSPRDEDGKEIGGRTAYFATLEYTLPMPLVSLLDVSVYYDIGNVTADAFDFDQERAVSDVGVGLTILAKNMPLRLDLAWPREVSEDDATNEEGRHRFSFAAGYNF
jgi:outer membrane protein assembly factor BamA